MSVTETWQRHLEALQSKASLRILALETSCDETAAAVVENGRRILSNIVFSQVDVHALYGGVVPEIASRAHVDACDRVIDLALQDAGMTLADVDALAVTHGPGLVGALLTGVSCMKGLSFATGLPLIPVNHIEGHVSANYLSDPALTPPFLCLVASGGHSHLVRVEDYGVYTLLGRTVDDAAGEAFDKGARVLGVPYPGGPMLSKLARDGDPTYLRLPRPNPEGRYDFSFSGLKTAFVNACHKLEQKGEPLPRADLAASYQKAIVDSLCEKAVLAMREGGLSTLCLAGGVSANALLREQMTDLAAREGFRLCMPEVSLCTDNAAMIGSAAYYRLRRGEIATLSLNAEPALALAMKRA
ncbi:MAG: tRNA (adenosine(37)-N6)-threonylcarbamoyltransferase complex transferase subunit TsaD [Clostridiales bacterium]|nr:tRNA (adenosine(37)-N6)-threonylcarbamoyltransferase complex transferase subunit TsaD [Clostridiales bacterium]